MHPVGERAKELLPSVLLTLMSIMQALTLEVPRSSASGSAHLWQPGAARIAGWLQVIAVIETILLVCVYYAHLVMRLRWIPTMRDSVIPFGFGIGEFVVAEMLAPERLALWFAAVAALGLLGGLNVQIGAGGTWAVFATAAVAAILLAQLALQRYSWNRSVRELSRAGGRGA